MSKQPKTVADISDAYLACRDFGHAWRPLDVRIARRAGEIHRVFSCLHGCGTERTQVLSLTGYILRSRYAYADDYVLPGLGRLNAEDRAAVRVASSNYYKARGKE